MSIWILIGFNSLKRFYTHCNNRYKKVSAVGLEVHQPLNCCHQLVNLHENLKAKRNKYQIQKGRHTLKELKRHLPEATKRWDKVNNISEQKSTNFTFSDELQKIQPKRK